MRSDIMKKTLAVCLGIALALVGWRETNAQQPEETEPAATKAELDAFRDGLFHAFNEGNYEEMLKEFCHKDMIAVWQDGTTSKGHAGVLAEFDKLSKFIDKMEAYPTTEDRLILNDGTLVISSGPMNDKYALSRGVDVELQSKWSATLVKEDDKWLLASFSASSNAFDNEVVSLFSARRSTGAPVLHPLSV